MQIQLITPEKIFFQGDAEMVTIPGTEGEFGVLAGHAPFVSTLKPGVITIEQQGGAKRRIVVLSGLAEVVPDHCTVLAESAEDVTALTQADAQAKLQAAKKGVDDVVSEAEKKAAEYHLAVAEALVQSFQH